MVCFSDMGGSFTLAEFIKETENDLGRDTHLHMENLTDMNLLEDECPVSNQLFSYFSVQYRQENRTENISWTEMLLNSYLMQKSQ